MRYVCTVCGFVYDDAPAVCPLCRAEGEKVEPVKEEKSNPYAGTQTEKNL